MTDSFVLLRRPKCLEQMYLRPARDVLEQPYSSGLLCIEELRKEPKSTIWLLNDPCQAGLLLAGAESHKTLFAGTTYPRG